MAAPQEKDVVPFSNDPAIADAAKDISNEEIRIYQFWRDGSLVPIQIAQPLKLHVSKSGGHRIQTADGLSMYVPAGWVLLMWKPKAGAPAFDF